MTPQELKNSILQLAIQGKLVDQRPEEGTGKELLEKILRDRAAETTKQTRTTGKAKVKSRVASRASSVSSVSSVPVVPPIPDDEKPFDIPESWEWVRLGDAFDIEMGQSPDGASVSEVAGGLEFHQGKIFFGEKYLKQSPQRTTAPTKIAEPNSVLLCVRAPVGKVNITSRRICIGRGLCSVLPLAGMDVDFVYYLLAAFETTFVRHATGTTFVAITGKVVKMFPIPLPPLAEQKRIVAKIEELLPLIDRYEKAWSKLEDFNRRFPVDMQKSVLQMAIQGKLVDQRPEEGTGEELLEKILATKNAKGAKKNLTRSRGARGGKNTSALSASPREEISDDEKPFDIPESWVWVRLESATDMLAGFAFKSTDFKTEGKYRLLRGINLGVSNIRWKDTVYVDSMTERIAEYRLKSGDVLIGLDRPWISDGTRVAIFDDSKETYLVQRVLRLRETGLLTSAFIALLLRSSLLSNSIGDKTTGISVPHISPGQVGNLVVPLPPLAEQKRIVARLEEILPLCERLKGSVPL